MYSQNDEEKYILESVAHLDGGLVIDIGAYDGVTRSNSRALIEWGWSAVLIEPSPGPFRRLVELYGGKSGIVLFNCAIGTTDAGFVKMHLSDDGISTEDEGFYETWKDAAHFLGLAYVYRGNWRDTVFKVFADADVISIDIEGGSTELWLAMSNHLMPHVWCVEFDGNQSRKDVAMIANGRGYDVIYESNENLVMRKR